MQMKNNHMSNRQTIDDTDLKIVNISSLSIQQNISHNETCVGNYMNY